MAAIFQKNTSYVNNKESKRSISVICISLTRTTITFYDTVQVLIAYRLPLIQIASPTC